MQIQTFEDWCITPTGEQAINLSCFKSLPLKHHCFIINRLNPAYNDGVAAAKPAESELVLTPPIAEETWDAE